jgi:hypothetical protein
MLRGFKNLPRSSISESPKPLSPNILYRLRIHIHSQWGRMGRSRYFLSKEAIEKSKKHPNARLDIYRGVVKLSTPRYLI